MRSRLAALASAPFVLAACGGSATLQSPDATLATYVRAVEEGDYRGAYDLLAEDTRTHLSYEAFVRSLGSDRGATQARAGLLGHVPTSSETHAIVQIDGEPVELVIEEGAFRIVGNPAAPVDQSTPRGVARSFVYALEERRADLLLALAPPAAREALDATQIAAALESENRAAYAELAAALRSALGSVIEVTGQTATMRFGNDRRLRMIRVDSIWYVDGVD